jgi:hypothetical protein
MSHFLDSQRKRPSSHSRSETPRCGASGKSYCDYWNDQVGVRDQRSCRRPAVEMHKCYLHTLSPCKLEGRSKICIAGKYIYPINLTVQREYCDIQSDSHVNALLLEPGLDIPCCKLKRTLCPYQIVGRTLIDLPIRPLHHPESDCH